MSSSAFTDVVNAALSVGLAQTVADLGFGGGAIYIAQIYRSDAEKRIAALRDSANQQVTNLRNQAENRIASLEEQASNIASSWTDRAQQAINNWSQRGQALAGRAGIDIGTGGNPAEQAVLGANGRAQDTIADLADKANTAVNNWGDVFTLGDGGN